MSRENPIAPTGLLAVFTARDVYGDELVGKRFKILIYSETALDVLVKGGSRTGGRLRIAILIWGVLRNVV